MPHTTATAPKVTGLNCDGPVTVRELGSGNQGIVWTVQPEHFARLIDMVNNCGGPDFWEIKAVAA